MIGNAKERSVTARDCIVSQLVRVSLCHCFELGPSSSAIVMHAVTVPQILTPSREFFGFAVGESVMSEMIAKWKLTMIISH